MCCLRTVELGVELLHGQRGVGRGLPEHDLEARRVSVVTLCLFMHVWIFSRCSESACARARARARAGARSAENARLCMFNQAVESVPS